MRVLRLIISIFSFMFIASGCELPKGVSALESVPGCDSAGNASQKNPHCVSTPSPTSCATQFGNKVDAISHGSLGLSPCAIRDGHVKCWGENGYLGIANTDNFVGDGPGEMGSCLPSIDLGTNAFATKVAETNSASRCALLSDGTVKCWGANSLGELGLGDLTARASASTLGNNLPAVDLGAGAIATDLIASNRTFCAVLTTGQVKCWGAFSYYSYFAGNPGFVGDVTSDMGNNLQTASLPAGRTVKKIAASSAGICAILDDNSLYCWNPICNPDSSNYIGPTFTCSNMMAGSWIPLGSIPLGSAAKEITVGNNFACVILTGGTVKCWGANDVGQLGQGDNVNRAYDNAHVGDISAMPAVDLGTGRMALKISAGSQHVCALLDNGSVKCWGNNSDGQLGLEDTVARGNSLGQMGDNLPIVSLGTGRTAIDISAGAIQTCALLDDQTVKCWGFNNDGRLGQGNTTSIGATAGTMGDALSAIQLW